MSSKILYEEGDVGGNDTDSVWVQVRQHYLDKGDGYTDVVMEWRVRVDGETIARGRKLIQFNGFRPHVAREQRAGIAKFDELSRNHPSTYLRNESANDD